ncbi:MAG: hypothetical protein M3319_06145 [Actinomycetota bacterium]|nr:hypothetical protein [Actinomycetota bacterium]
MSTSEVTITQQRNKEIVRRLFAAFTANDVRTMDELLARDFTAHGLAPELGAGAWRRRTRRPREKSAVDSDVVDAMAGHPVDARSRVDIRATMCPTGSTLQITRRDSRPRWTISPPPLNER